MGRLADNHGGEELPAKPGAATGRHRLLDDGNLDVGVLGELISGGEASGTGAHNDDVCLSKVVQVVEVPGVGGKDGRGRCGAA